MDKRLFVVLLLIISSGFALNTLSVSQVDLVPVGGSNPFPRQAWLVTATVTNSPSSDLWSSGEYVESGWFTPQDEQEGKAGDRRIRLDMKPTNQRCEYTLYGYSSADSPTGVFPISQVEVSEYYGSSSVSLYDWLEQNCPIECTRGLFGSITECHSYSDYVVWAYYQDYPLTFKRRIACVWMRYPPDKTNYIFRKPSGQQSIFFGVEVGVKDEYGHEVSGTISTQSPSLWLDSDVFAQLQGGLQTGILCPDASNWRVVRVASDRLSTTQDTTLDNFVQSCLPKFSDFSGFQWSLTPDEMWESTNTNTYVLSVNTWFGTVIGDAIESFHIYEDSWSDVSSAIGSCNQLYNTIYNGEDVLPAEVKQNLVALDISADLLRVIFKNYLIVNPVVRFFIDSDWVRIVVMIPQPEIVDIPSSINLVTGIPTSLPVTIKNVGNAPGSIVVTADCGPVSVSPASQTISLDPGATQTVSFTLQYSGTSSQTFTCTVEAYASSDPSKKDTATTSINYQYTGGQCIPGTKWCEGTKIMYCTENREVAVYTDCATQGNYTCAYVEGEPVCREAIVPPPPPEEGKPWWEDLLLYIGIGVALGIAAIFLLRVAEEKMKK